MSNDDDHVFPQGIIRGLGLLPGGERKKWPDASATTKSTTKEPEGVGKEPEGVGALLRPDLPVPPPPAPPGSDLPPGLPPGDHSAVAKANLQAAGSLVAAPAEHAPKFDPRGFWYTHGAMPSKAPQAGHGVWQQVGQHWVWCPATQTNLPNHLMAVCQVGSPGAGWTQIFNNYWVAKQQQIAVG
jgi:hypothetical protein